MRLLELLPRERDPLPDLAGAFGGALTQAALELRDVGCDEQRHAAGNLPLHGEGALELQLEDTDPPLGQDSFELGAGRPVAPAGHVRNVLEELPLPDAPLEL